MLEELARDYMKEMLERICIEADVSDSPLLGILRGAKNLGEIQEILRNMMNDQKVGSAFKRQVAFLFDFEERSNFILYYNVFMKISDQHNLNLINISGPILLIL